MIIDVHTHAFPPEVCRYREKYMENEWAFKTLYGHPRARMVTSEELVQAMDEHGVDMSFVFGFPWVDKELARRHNDYILESASKYPHRLIPLVCVNPARDYATQEVERCLKAGARGAGELAVYGNCDADALIERYRDIGEVTRRHGGFLLIHANEPVGHKYPGKAPQGLQFYYEVVKALPEIPVILAHWGGGLFFFELLKKEAKDILKNVYYDTAASPFLYDSRIYSIAAEILGANKILLGTDYPLLPPERYIKEMQESGIPEDRVRAISGGNALRILDFYRAHSG
ncbi:amidohydrolase family protein [Thermodesulforhabdus norvegica]|uniref:Amidohydrolase-related domain-containing protein n=1 Tax=Thermodesulforhabdus norvegica TaxID=39841 RepID=A0A1I4SBH3_9BACT|nr:amidohydrolase family protein [Thermodesulforhabdus norvegica]SFM61876.1 hypothetical protein SAMN05660836_00874 [Thermodesulforhabdus norvegica]